MQPGAAELERQRVQEILDLCGEVGEYDLAQRFIASGDTVATARKFMLLDTAIRRPPSLGLSRSEISRYSITRAIRALVAPAAGLGERRDAFEWEIHDDLVRRFGEPASARALLMPPDVFRRDLTVAGTGGVTVGTSSSAGGFVSLARGRSIVAALGAEPLEGLVGNVVIPRLTGGVVSAWPGTEASGPSESTPAFGQITLSPHTVSAYTELSRQLILQTSASAERIVENDLLSALAQAIDGGAINGGGAAGELAGVLLRALAVNAIDGTSLDATTLDEFHAAIDADIGDDATAVGWAANPTIARLLKRRHEVANTWSPLWRGSHLDGHLDGLPARSSTRVPASTLLLGDWSSVVIAGWGTLQLEANPYDQTNFQRGIVGIRVMHAVDVGMRRPDGFAASITVS